LGVWWVLLNPSLMALTWWLVFSELLRIPVGKLGVPFIVYLVSGITVTTVATQTITLVGGSLIWNEFILSKIRVQPEILAFSSGLATSVSAGILLIPLLIIQVVVGLGIPQSVVFIPLVLATLLCFCLGIGLLVAAMAARFPDTLNIMAFFLQLLVFLAPTFYPISIVPERYLPIFELNPIYHFLVIFRSASYGGSAGPVQSWIFAGTSTGVALLIGSRAFARAARRTVVKT